MSSPTIKKKDKKHTNMHANTQQKQIEKNFANQSRKITN